MKTLITLLLVGLAGCGQAPLETAIPLVVVTDEAPGILAPEPSPTPSPSPLPPPTVLTFIYFNSPGICSAVAGWNPITTTIVFPANSGGGVVYTFDSGGIWIHLADGSQKGLFTGTITKDGAFNNPPVCIITVDHGHLVGVQ